MVNAFVVTPKLYCLSGYHCHNLSYMFVSVNVFYRLCYLLVSNIVLLIISLPERRCLHSNSTTSVYHCNHKIKKTDKINKRKKHIINIKVAAFSSNTLDCNFVRIHLVTQHTFYGITSSSFVPVCRINIT